MIRHCRSFACHSKWHFTTPQILTMLSTLNQCIENSAYSHTHTHLRSKYAALIHSNRLNRLFGVNMIFQIIFTICRSVNGIKQRCRFVIDWDSDVNRTFNKVYFWNRIEWLKPLTWTTKSIQFQSGGTNRDVIVYERYHNAVAPTHTELGMDNDGGGAGRLRRLVSKLAPSFSR